MNEGQEKTIAGRPAGSRLDDVSIQDVIRQNIARTGDVYGCHAGICSRRTFDWWKKHNRAKWDRLKKAGMDEFALQIRLAAPDILEKALARLNAKIDNDEVNPHDLLEIVKYFDTRRKKA